MCSLFCGYLKLYIVNKAVDRQKQRLLFNRHAMFEWTNRPPGARLQIGIPTEGRLGKEDLAGIRIN